MRSMKTSLCTFEAQVNKVQRQRACRFNISIWMDLHDWMTEYHHIPKLQGKLKVIINRQGGSALYDKSLVILVQDKALNHHIKDMV